MDGLDDEHNIVLLTSREHFIAHALLAFHARKNLTGSIKRDLIFAHYMMKAVGRTGRSYMNSRLYGDFGNAFDSDVRHRISKKSKEMWQRPGFKKKMKKIMAHVYNNDQYKRNVSIRMKKLSKTEGWKRFHSNIFKKMWGDPIKREKIISNMKLRFITNPNANCSFKYTITDPDGISSEVFNITVYSKEHNMTSLDFRNGQGLYQSEMKPKKGKWKGYIIKREQI
jgi:hypothetical protein